MAASSLTHLDEVMATKDITLMERWDREHVAIGLKGGFVRADKMSPTGV